MICFQISVNGYVTFELGLRAWLPANFPHSSLPSFNRFLPMIAPFWADIDLRQTPGKVLYHVYSRELLDPSYEYIMPRDKLVFDWVTDQIWTNVGDYGFVPTMVVVVTWQTVSPYPGYQTNNEVKPVVLFDLHCSCETIGKCKYIYKCTRTLHFFKYRYCALCIAYCYCVL